MNLKDYIKELQRRNVIKASLAYLVVAWLAAQIASIVLPTFNAPDYLMKALVFLLVLGFPINFVFAWIYDITPEGIQKTQHLNSPNSHLKNNKLNKAITGSLILAISLLLFKQFNSSAAKTEQNASEKEIINTEISPDNTIAVIPFENASDDKQNEYFVNGMTEDIRNNLGEISDLMVRSKTSSEKYRITKLSSKEIGKELVVSYLLEGTVQKIGNQVKIHAQLITTENDDHIWQETYIKDISNIEEIFKIQSAIAHSIANQLKIVISPNEKSRLESVPTKNIEAYDYFLRAQELTNEYNYSLNITAAEKAKEFYTKAIELDTSLLVAYVGLGRLYWSLAHFDMKSSRSENYKNSKRYLKEAIRINPNNGWAYAELAVVSHNWDWDIEAAIKNLNMAIKLMPNKIYPYEHYFWLELRNRNCTRLEDLLIKIKEIDPEMKLPYSDYNLLKLFCERDFVQINSILKRHKLISNEKNSSIFRWIAFTSYLMESNFDRASSFTNQNIFLTSPKTLKALVAFKKGNTLILKRAIDSIKENSKKTDFVQTELAGYYAYLNNKDQMYFHLERALEMQESEIHNIIMSPQFDPYINEPRFQEIIRKMWIPKEETTN